MSRISRAFDRVPVRIRVTLAFSAVLAVVLLATGLFLDLRLARELDAQIDRGLRSRAADVSALIEQADSGLAQAGRSPLTERGASVAQVIGSDGRVIDAPPPLRSVSLLTGKELQRARRATIYLRHRRSPLGRAPVRLLATPVRAQGKNVVIVVGSQLDTRNQAVANLRGLLFLGGPIALLLASLAGYGAAAAALRPVESMRRRAREIQAGGAGQRLPVSTARDELSRLGATLNEMLARLEAAFERERLFVADASHELRTPLAILRGELELALRDARTVDEFRTSVMSASEEADRVVQLAEDLLVIARADQGRLPIRRERLDLAELLEAARTRIARRAEDHGVTLTVAPTSEAAYADPLRLQQALGNLLDNALRYGAHQVEIQAVAEGRNIELHVRDDGEGFAPEFVGHAFERFTRADAARTRGGAGLGLAIVDVIARAHGGSVGASNREHGGADVWVSLPAAAD